MDQQTAQRVLTHPKFQEIARKKSVLGWSFSALMLFVYVVFILFIGFSPESFGVPVSPGSEAIERDWEATAEEVAKVNPFAALASLKK